MLMKRFRYLITFLLTFVLIFFDQSLGYTNPQKPKTKATPSPAASTSIPKINIDFADTNVPQILSLTSTAENVDENFVVTLVFDIKIRKNTLASIDIGLAQKTTAGAYVDPIFQAPCTPLNKFTSRTLNSQGDLTALVSRSIDGDWYKEKYVLTNTSKLGTNLVPCLGDYLLTSLSLVDSAKHTLNLTANLASTASITQNRTTAGPSPSPTRSAQPNQNTNRFNDVGIMRSNIWNSRLDVAPCTAGTNQLPTVTTTLVNGRSTQVMKEPTIIPTDRIACNQIIGIDLTRPIISIKTNPTDSPIFSTSTGLPLFDKTLISNEEVESLKAQISALKKKNKQLTKELSKLKNKSQTKGIPTPKPTSRTNNTQGSSSSNQNSWERNTNGSRSSRPQSTPTPTKS